MKAVRSRPLRMHLDNARVRKNFKECMTQTANKHTRHEDVATICTDHTVPLEANI